MKLGSGALGKWKTGNNKYLFSANYHMPGNVQDSGEQQ